VKVLYNEKFKILMKEVTEDTQQKWKDILCLRIGRIKKNIVKIPILPKAKYRSNAIPIKILIALFTVSEKTIKKLT
jgi:hypothetical protein